MAWFKKEKQTIEEEIPELPELPDPNEFSLPELSTPDEFSPPKLPNPNKVSAPGLQNPNFNIDSKYMPQLPKLPELKNKFPNSPTIVRQEIMNPPQEMQRSQFGTIETHSRQDPPLVREAPLLSEPLEINEVRPRLSAAKNAEPIYVRLDKFETSLQSIEEIKRKIAEVEDILKKTKEIKQKEEQELEAWEREVHIIKSKINTIDKDIFNKFD